MAHRLSKALKWTGDDPRAEFYALQDGKCAICGKRDELRRLALDHCHKTGKLRGLLCMQCNTGLGQFRDDTNLLQKAITYLSK